MQIRQYLKPEEFLAECGPILEREEALNNLILGLAKDMIAHPPKDPKQAFIYSFMDAEIHGDPRYGGHMHSHPGEPYMFALQTETRRGLVLASTDQMPPERLYPIMACLRGMHPDSEACTGPRALAKAFAESWGPTAHLHFPQLVYQCHEVKMPTSKPPGHMRAARPEDIHFLPEWVKAFMWESLRTRLSNEEAHAAALSRLERGSLWIWEQQRTPVAMLQILRPTTNGCMVGYVYTPDQHRKRGYASILTAEATQAQLDAGKKFVGLFTDEGNATSNKIYQDIGFKPIAEFAHYMLK